MNGRTSAAPGELREGQQAVFRFKISDTATGTPVQSAGARRPATNAPATPAGAGPNVDAMVADVRTRLTEGKLIDPPGDSARDLLANLRTAAPNRPEVDELSRTL